MINKAIIIGNLGADPEMKQTQTGSSVANFNVATSEQWTGKDGQRQEQTEWHRIVAFGRLGEICGQYLNKGSKVYIEGRIQTREWQDQDGNTKYTTEIVAREMKMLDSRQTDSNHRDRSDIERSNTDTDGSNGSPGSSSMGDDVPF
jgi:single-strand DNA-binding protein